MKRGSGESGGWCGCQDENGGGDDEGDLRRERNESGDGDGVMRVEFCCLKGDRSRGRGNRRGRISDCALIKGQKSVARREYA